MGSWSILGADALISEPASYKPDFSAYVASEDFRFLRLERNFVQNFGV
jgi:hypothetical protein